MRRARKIVVVGASIIAVASLATVAYTAGFVRLQYPTREEFPVQGVDVSRHQREIDWPTLARTSGISFAFIKASEGSDLRDPRFRQNWSGAEGLVSRSAYHFFTFCSSGEAQARNFLTAAPEAGELPRAVDVEFSGNCRSWSSLGEIRRQLKIFVGVLAAVDGRPPVLYVTKSSFNRIVRGHFDDVPLWVQEVVWRPSADDYPNFTFWHTPATGALTESRP